MCVNKIDRWGHMRWTWTRGILKLLQWISSVILETCINHQEAMIWSIRSPCRPGHIYLSACASPLSHPCPLTYLFTHIQGWWNRSIKFNNLLRACTTYILISMTTTRLSTCKVFHEWTGSMGCSTFSASVGFHPRISLHCFFSSSCQAAPCWTEPPLWWAQWLKPW